MSDPELLLRAVPSLRERDWRPPSDAEALRAEARELVAQRHPLTDVGPDHQAATP